MESNIFERSHTWQGGNVTTTSRPGWIGLAAVSSVALLIGIFTTGFVVGHGPVAGLVQQRQTLAIRLATLRRGDARSVAGLEHRIEAMLAHRARCYSDGTDIGNIQRLLNTADYHAAAALADLDLTSTSKPACPQTQAGLASLWYTASINGLLSAPPTSPLDQTPVLTWRSIERRADALGALCGLNQTGPRG